MSSPSVGIFLDTRGESSNKKYPLKLRVCANRSDNRSRNMGFSFTVGEYEKMMANITKSPYKDTWNKIKAKLDRAEKILQDLSPFFSYKEFWERYSEKTKTLDIIVDKTSLNYVAERVCENYMKTGQYPMTIKIRDSVSSILKFSDTKNLPLRTITPKFCREYEEYMFKKSKTSTRNGAGINLRHIRILFNQGIDMGLIPRSWYPFKRESGERSEFPDPYVIPNERKVKDYLREEEVLEFSEAVNFSTEAQKHAHDAWLISYHCNGCNPADFLEFKYKDIKGEFIIFYREKIKNATRSDRKPVKVYLTKELKALIKEIGNTPLPNNYIFKCYESGMTMEEKYEARKRFVNKASQSLKHLAKNLGIKKNLRLGNARHSLANILKKNKVDREVLKDLFGHTSIITADNYFGEFEEDEQKQVANNVMSIDSIKERLKKNPQ